jgi:hypothetical protein
VINSYKDGPPEPGKAPLGPFFELETRAEADLDRLARATIKVRLDELKNAFPSSLSPIAPSRKNDPTRARPRGCDPGRDGGCVRGIEMRVRLRRLA